MNDADLLNRITTLIARGTKPIVPEVKPLVDAYRAKPGNGCGGALHIVIEDGNIRDEDVQLCVDGAREDGDALGENLGAVLLLMSRTQRAKV